MERNTRRKVLRPIARMSPDAVRAMEHMNLNGKPTPRPNNNSSSAGHFHRSHHQQPMTTARSSFGDSEKESKSASLLPASRASRYGQMHLLFAIDEHPNFRAAAAAGKERVDKKPSTELRRNSLPKKSVSCNKLVNQSINHSLLRKPEKQNDSIRWKEPETSAQRTVLPLRDDGKSSVSLSLPNSSGSEAKTMPLPQLQEEKPFRISPMGYDSRYEDLIYESQRCVDDDKAPEQTTQAIDKCKLWLKKHHMDNYESRSKHH